MNGARSTFMRKGYLLTALAAAVLLAASPGVASAQRIGFSGSSATVMEGAAPGDGTPNPIVVTITISGLTTEGDNANNESGLGTITIAHNADVAYPGQEARTGDNQRIWIDGESSALDEAETVADSALVEHTVASGKYGLPTGGEIHYDNNGEIKLVIIDPGGDGNWVDNDFFMDIESAGTFGISPSPGSFKVTVTDDDVQPAATFSKTSIALTEGTQTTSGNPVAINVGVPMGTDAANTPDITSLTNNIQFTTAPAGAAVAACVADSDDDVIALTAAGFAAVAGEDDTWQLSQGAGDIGTVTIGIEACGDMSGFNDEMVTFSFDAMSLAGTPAGWGNLAAGPDLVVTVRSEGEDKPTVTFATTSIDIDEGETNTVAILADGELGPEVGMVMVSMSGDAMLSLWQGDDMLEANADGMYSVDLGGSANTILTISADSDRALETGMTATATITIESANGADIGDRDSLMVTVNGSTEVPVLPLVGQLLLALFLMAGGMRLYRRRQD